MQPADRSVRFLWSSDRTDLTSLNTFKRLVLALAINFFFLWGRNRTLTCYSHESKINFRTHHHITSPNSQLIVHREIKFTLNIWSSYLSPLKCYFQAIHNKRTSGWSPKTPSPLPEIKCLSCPFHSSSYLGLKPTYVVGSISFWPDQLFKVREIKQLCHFSTVSLYFNTLFNWYINLTIDGTIYPSQHFPFGAAFACQARNFLEPTTYVYIYIK